MTDQAFILILKAKLKQFYLEDKSVGMEVQALVSQFRQEIEDDALRQKYNLEQKRSFKQSLNPTKWQH